MSNSEDENPMMLEGMTIAEFAAASDHPYDCKCRICLLWWKNMPHEDEDE